MQPVNLNRISGQIILVKGGESMGRDSLKIDKEEFEKLCEMQCTKKEIASFFGASENGLQHWCIKKYGMRFKEVFKTLKLRGFVSLRRKLYKKAIKDEDTKVLLYLADNWLGMNKKYELTTPNINIDLSNISDEDLSTLERISKNVINTAQELIKPAINTA